MLSQIALEQSGWDSALQRQGLSAGLVFAVTNSAVHQMGSHPYIPAVGLRQLPPCCRGKRAILLGLDMLYRLHPAENFHALL